MVKRHPKNIGKRVTPIGNHPMAGRVGIIKRFRGNNTPSDPWVQVYFDGGSMPIKGSRLKYLERTL